MQSSCKPSPPEAGFGMFAEYARQMAERLEIQYYALRREIADIQSNWREYLELFETSPYPAEALNQASRRVLRTVQHEGWAACLLALARLTDVPNPADEKMLTIQNLPL